MSAGIVLAMSGDDTLMDYHSCLGPVNPQLQLEDRLVPALSYLAQEPRREEQKRDAVDRESVSGYRKRDGSFTLPPKQDPFGPVGGAATNCRSPTR